MMKSRFLSCIACALFVACCATVSWAQNNSPKVEDFEISKSGPKALEINYSVMDDEESKVSVGVQVFDEQRQRVGVVSITGHVGASVSCGDNKSIKVVFEKDLTSYEKLEVKLTADDGYQVAVQDLVNQVSLDNLKANLEFVEGRRFPITLEDAKHHKEVRQYIKDKFTTEKGTYLYTQDTALESFKVQNIIAEVGGTSNQSKTYILSAHYDAWFKSPGADDNASGVAGLLEASRILSQYNFDHTIRFVAFDMEEHDLLGSRVYVQGQKLTKKEVEGVINFDMIGVFSDKPKSQKVPDVFKEIFPEQAAQVAANDYRGNFAILNHNEASQGLVTAIRSSASEHVPGFEIIPLNAMYNGEYLPDLAASDHFSFWQAGISAVHMGDGGDTRNKFINTKKDKLKLINYPYMVKVVGSTVAALAKLGGINHAVSYTKSYNPSL